MGHDLWPYRAGELACFGVIDRSGIELDMTWSDPEAMGWAEKEVAWTRVGYHGRTAGGRSVGRYAPGTGLVWTRWDHWTNRACEPQLHAHVAVLNRVITTSDGQIRALDGRGFRAVKHGIDALYVQGLEQRISDWCGVAFGLRPDGKAREILGIEAGLLAEASSWHSAVATHLKELVGAYRARHGHEPGPSARTKLGRQAALATREAKSHQPVAEQIGEWCASRTARLERALSQTRTAAQRAARMGRDQRNHPEQDVEHVLAAAVGAVQARHATWDVGLLMSAIADQITATSLAGGLEADVPGLAGQVLAEPARFGIVQLNAPEPGLIPIPAELRRADGTSMFRPHRDQRYTTLGQLSVENSVVALAGAHGAVGVDPGSVGRVREWCDSAGLGPDQVAAVIGIVSSGRVGDVLIGPAGAGKSHTLAALAQVWGEHTGERVVGLATSQIATLELADNGLEAVNTTQFLIRTTPDQHGHITDPVRPGDLVILDEVGMSPTAEISRILGLVAAAGGKVVFTGDTAQLAAIDAGGLLGLLAAENGSFELTEVHRFHRPWEQAASLRLRAGDEQVLDVYERHGRLVGGTAEEVTERAVRAYLADTLTGKTSLLVTATNTQAAELAAHIHDELVRLGRVDDRVLGVARDGNSIGAGDLIHARRNDRTITFGTPGQSGGDGATVTNRATYRVLGSDPSTGGVRVADSAGQTAVLPPAYVGEHVTLAYAATVWAAQGRTVETSHAVLQPGATRRGAYVALTRGREANTAYVVCERDGDEHHHEPLTSTARAQLTAILANTDDDSTTTAEQARRTALDEAKSLAWIAGQWDLIATDATRGDCEGTIRALLPATTARQVLAEPGCPRLCRALRAAELAGHDPTAVLAEVIGERSLFNADSITDVLRWRIHTTTPSRTPERESATGWAGIGHPRPGPVGEYLAALAGAADTRQTELGAHALDKQPEWAVHHLGPPPNTAADRDEWTRRAAAIAAYRELAANPRHHHLPRASAIARTTPAPHPLGARDHRRRNPSRRAGLHHRHRARTPTDAHHLPPAATHRPGLRPRRTSRRTPGRHRIPRRRDPLERRSPAPPTRDTATGPGRLRHPIRGLPRHPLHRQSRKTCHDCRSPRVLAHRDATGANAA